MSSQQPGSTPFTVFDYLGLGFILEPPGVLVHAVMTGEPLQWSKAWYALPFIIVGAVSIYIGRNWDTIKQGLNTNFADAIDRLSRTYVVPFIVFMFVISGVAILPLLIWPPNASESVAALPTADEIAAAVVQKLPTSQVQPQATTTANTEPIKQPWERLQKNYLPAEKAKLIELLSDVRAELDGDGLAASTQGYRYGNWMPESKDDMRTLQQQLDATRQLIEKTRNQIDVEIIGKNAFYAEDLMTVVGDDGPLNRFRSALEDFSRELEIFQSRYNDFNDDDRRWIAFELIKRFSTDVVNSSGGFQNWIQLCSSKIDAKAAALK